MPIYGNQFGYYGNPAYGAYASPQIPQPNVMMSGTNSLANCMISVDGEMAARAWQPSTPMPPNFVVPLWDLDGIHVYFKSTDAYGRINPIRKARVVFDDEQTNLVSGNNEPLPVSEAVKPDMSQYVTKEDFNELKNEMRRLMRTNQNGNAVSKPQQSNYSGARGGRPNDGQSMVSEN